VICKYVQIDPEMVTCSWNKRRGYFDSGAERDAPGSGRVASVGFDFVAPVSAAPPGICRAVYHPAYFIADTFQQRIQAIGHQFPAPAAISSGIHSAFSASSASSAAG
jgi:hypothetical protein